MVFFEGESYLAALLDGDGKPIGDGTVRLYTDGTGKFHQLHGVRPETMASASLKISEIADSVSLPIKNYRTSRASEADNVGGTTVGALDYYFDFDKAAIQFAGDK